MAIARLIASTGLEPEPPIAVDMPPAERGR
jgi:hypothetical protein